jgi:biopolymer transport protein TolR
MRRVRKPINQINVVPYIDVMLVLLVIFMVTAPLVAPGEIQLPSVGSKLTPAINALRITVKPDKSIELVDEASSNKRPVKATLDTLVGQVRDIQGDRDQPVVIVADGSSPYQYVIGILDRLQQGGIRRVGLLARPNP